MRKCLLFAFILSGLGVLGYVDWQETLPESATYIHIAAPVLHHTWTCKDGASGCTTTTTRDCVPATTSCNITIGSTTAGSVGVACEQVFTLDSTLTVTGGGTWVTPAGSHGVQGAVNEAVECAYNLNMTGATTSITCTFSVNVGANGTCIYLNFTGTGSSFTFDTSGTAVDTTCTTCAGAAMTTTTANNYLLVQVAACGGSCSAVNQSYTGNFFGNDGMAYKLNVSTAGTTPNWTMTSGTLAGGAIAIYEVISGGGTVRHRAWVTQQ